MIDIRKTFGDKDIVYHYTTTETALNYILKGKEIRLSPRRASIDPVENIDEWYSYSGGGNKSSSPEIKANARKVTDLFKKRFTKTKQVCFCENNELKNEEKMTSLPIEKYGFFKPRMWDNYADRYKGVCLAFSLKELIAEADKNDIIFNRINYIDTGKIKRNHITIDLENVGLIGIEEYFNQNIKKEGKHLFDKHNDYSGEKEFRFCSFSEKEFDYLNISNALRGVFISNIGLNNNLMEAFREVIPSTISDDKIVQIKWSDTGVNLHSYKEIKSRQSLIEGLAKQSLIEGLAK